MTEALIVREDKCMYLSVKDYYLVDDSVFAKILNDANFRKDFLEELGVKAIAIRRAGVQKGHLLFSEKTKINSDNLNASDKILRYNGGKKMICEI